MNFFKKLERTPDTADPRTIELFAELKGLRKQGFVTRKQGLDILKWKSPRPLRHYEANSEEAFREVSSMSFGTRDERLKMHTLMALKGVQIPSASAILMFYDPKKYPVIDIRVWKQLHKTGFVQTNPRGQGFSLDEWEEYLYVVRHMASVLQITPRQVEKRIYDIDRKEQVGTLYG